MLMGTYQNSIDGKNRISVPVKFREELGCSCIITKDVDPCIALYPEEAFKIQAEKIARLPQLDPQVRRYRMETVGCAYDVEIDKQGRTVVPQFLKDFGKFDKDIIVVGAIDHVQFWSKAEYDRYRSEAPLTDADKISISEKYKV